jgi:hypothetical protein
VKQSLSLNVSQGSGKSRHLDHMLSETQPFHFEHTVYQSRDVDIKLLHADRTPFYIMSKQNFVNK